MKPVLSPSHEASRLKFSVPLLSVAGNQRCKAPFAPPKMGGATRNVIQCIPAVACVSERPGQVATSAITPAMSCGAEPWEAQ